MYIASFDIGIKNFACCIESLNSSKIIFLKLVNLLENYSESESVDKNTFLFLKCNEFIKNNFRYFDKCIYVLIEQQMNFGKKRNNYAVLIQNYLQSIFFFYYASFKKIIIFPAYHKTQVFDAPKMTKYERKKWAVLKVQSEYIDKENDDIKNYFNSLKKKDDLSDTIIQIKAFKKLYFDS